MTPETHGNQSTTQAQKEEQKLEKNETPVQKEQEKPAKKQIPPQKEEQKPDIQGIAETWQERDFSTSIKAETPQDSVAVSKGQSLKGSV